MGLKTRTFSPANFFLSTVCADCSIREYGSDFRPLCWHTIPAYYALNYAGIFDGGLAAGGMLYWVANSLKTAAEY